MEKWKDLLESHTDVDVKLIPWRQEQTTINIYKTCDEMSLAEFTLLYGIVNTTRNSLFIIDSESESSDRINILVRAATKCNLCAQSAERIFPTIYFCNNIGNNNWTNKLGRKCNTAMLPLPNGLRRKNSVYSLMPRIFVSATEHKYHNRFYHSTQQPRAVHKAHQDSRGHHMLSRHRKKHRVSTKRYKLLKLYREQETKQKIRKKASDILEVPIGRRKLLCKYRKSCYNTGIIPNTWNIHNILPRFMDSHAQENSSEKKSMTEMQIKNENEEKEEISEAELKLLCRYRKSCYEEVGAEIEKSTLKVQAGPIFSRESTILPATKQKSTKEIARMALAKAEEKEKIATLLSISTKAITEKNMNEIVEEMKKRLVCKYRKSCYDSGVLPEIDTSFDNLFQKIYYFVRGRNHEASTQEIIHKEFTDFNDDEKRVYCKYRKSCYNTGQKPVINHGEIFKYIHIVKKYEEVIPLEIRCKYRKSCYDTGILPDLKKKVAKEESPSAVPVQTVISLYHLKTFCKYRKSCYKQKAEEQQNFNVGLFDEAETLGNDEAERKEQKEKKIKKVIKSFQKESASKSEKTKEISTSKKMERTLGTKPTQVTDNKKLIKTSKVSVPELEGKRMATIIENIKFEKTVHKPKKKKIKGPAEEIPIRQAKKVQKTVWSTINMKQPITEKGIPERVEFKKEKLKAEKVEKEIRIKEEKIIKGKEISIAEEKDFEKEPTTTEIPPPSPVKEVQSVFLQAENITPPAKVNIYDENLSPLDIKLLCKYRKSCYESGKLPPAQSAKTVQDFEDPRQLEIRCKYRKSCYETGKLPQNLHENFKETHLIKKKEENIPKKYNPKGHIPLTLRCKYRKSCYKTGKLPSIKTSIFGFPTIQILNECKASIGEEQNREQLKLRCKYRKSCYESGILPLHLNNTAYVVTTSIKQYENLHLKCKYRKSCFENMKLDIQLDKVRKKVELKKVQEGIVKAPNQTEMVVRNKEKEQKKEIQDEVMNGKSKRTHKKKSKELKYEVKEQQYMQIEPLDSRSRQEATKLQLLNSSQKLKCKYRLKCYNSVPLHHVTEGKGIEKQRQLNIKDFRRANGAICNIYYISCRKQAGLPIIGRAPIGPNGRRLCRKKKKGISD
uniref:YqaJ domain-containing protein n=1 Tax=Loa loa TaxID=7209 RepID=A0A1I7VK21_LOALO